MRDLGDDPRDMLRECDELDPASALLPLRFDKEFLVVSGLDVLDIEVLDEIPGEPVSTSLTAVLPENTASSSVGSRG